MEIRKILPFIILTFLIILASASCSKPPTGPGPDPASPTPTITLGGDSTEPNDTYQQAAVITSGMPLQLGFSYWNDEDWVVFTLAQESEITLSISGFPTDGGGDDCPYLEAFPDPQGDSINAEFSFGYDTDSIQYSLTPGNYYLHIRHANYNFETFDYTLSLSVNPYPTATPEDTIEATGTETETETEAATFTDTPEGTLTTTPTITITLTVSKTETPTVTETPWASDAYEPDNTYSAAREFVPGTEPGRNLYPDGDEDWYFFTLSSPGEVSISASAGPQGWDMRMSVYYDYNLTTPLMTANGGFPDGICWLVRNFDAGTYYVRIYDADYSSFMSYDIFYGITLATLTVTPTATETHTNSPTGTPTCSDDAYEPDDLPTEAITITPGVTQYRSNYPGNDPDWIKFYVDYPSLYNIHIEGNPDYPHSAFVYSDNAGVPGTGINGCSGCYGAIDISGEAWTGLYWINADSSYAFHQYSILLTLITMTPSPTFTVTPTVTDTITLTLTYTVSDTHTITQTRTNSPTISPTHTITQTPTLTPGNTPLGAINCTGTPELPAIANIGGTPVRAWLEDVGGLTEVLYVDGVALTNTATFLQMTRRWISCNATDTYAVFNDNYYRTYVLTSANGWAGVLGGVPVYNNSLASAIYVDGTTPYVAYVDQGNSNKITVKYFDGSAWQVYGSPAFSNTALAGYHISMKGFNDGTLHLYVAFQDNINSNRLCVMAKHGAGDWAVYGGLVSEGFASWHDLDVIDGSTPIVTYTDFTSSNFPRVRYSTGSGWIDLGGGTASAEYSEMPSIRANSLSDVYLAYEGPGADGYLRHFNGSSWSPHGDKYSTKTGADYNVLDFFNGYIHVNWREYDPFTPPYYTLKALRYN